ncbi:MAG TPA: VOC family protein [Candidatus Saccharimonadales bacterium]|nr:VOC family protein [Candidatus Saccharimonadales bacterium]
MKKITPFLWFDDQAEQAMRFYVSIFENSRVLEVTPGPDGKTMGVRFELEGQEFTGLNAGPEFAFTEAISLYVNCKDQAEVDDLWAKLSAGAGEESRCGWVKDRFGLWWQIIPEALPRLMRDPDPVKAKRVVDAMLKMKKIDVAELERAYAG